MDIISIQRSLAGLEARFAALVSERDAQVQKLDELMKERDAQAQKLNELMKERDAQAQKLNELIKKLEIKIAAAGGNLCVDKTTT